MPRAGAPDVSDTDGKDETGPKVTRRAIPSRNRAVGRMRPDGDARGPRAETPLQRPMAGRSMRPAGGSDRAAGLIHLKRLRYSWGEMPVARLKTRLKAAASV
jgi:hypothetical protein